MTKSEALALSKMLPTVHADIQEVHIRLRMHREGKIILDDKSITDCERRLDSSVKTIALVNEMALAEID